MACETAHIVTKYGPFTIYNFKQLLNSVDYYATQIQGNEHYLLSMVIVRTFLQGIKLVELLSFVEGPGEVQIRAIVLFIRYSLLFTTFIMCVKCI